MVEIAADNAGWKMESIIACGPSNDDSQKYVYLVKWEGSTHDENTWETYENVSESSMDLLQDYYGKNPTFERDRPYEKKKVKS